MSPSLSCSIATCSIQLSPGGAEMVTAEPATEAPRQIGVIWCAISPVRPCASCTVATPHSPSRRMVSASARSMFCTTTPDITVYLPSEFVHCSREDRLAAGIALEMISPVFGHVGVVVPEVLLALHALDRRALLVPYFRDVEEDVR